MGNVMDTQNTPIYVWLGSNGRLDSDNFKKIKKHLKKNNSSLKTFDGIIDCKNFIEMSANEKILFVSGSYGRQIVPVIHDLPQLLGVYVYCSNKELHLQWANQYTKVYALKKCCITICFTSD